MTAQYATQANEARLDKLYLAHAGSSQNVARLLCGDDAEAVAAADAAFVRTVGLFRDLRSPLTFEASLRRAVIKECRPPMKDRIRNAADGTLDDTETDDAWSSFSSLPHRKKAALVLRYHERLSDDQVADVLGCSTGAARALVNRALTDIQGESPGKVDPSRTAGELVRTFNRRVTNTPLPVEPNRAAVHRARFRRVLSVVGATVILVAAAAAGFVFLS